MGAVRRQSEIEALVRFARFAGEPGDTRPVLEALADALCGPAGAAHVALVEIRSDATATLIQTDHLPVALRGLEVDCDALGEELADDLALRCGYPRDHVSSRMLVSNNDLFGLAMLFFTEGPDSERLRLAEGFIDLAALALSNAAHIASLGRSHAELRATFAALAHAERLNALGQMAAGITHDLKNILNPLSLHVQFLERAIARGKLDEAMESLGDMRRVVARGVETVERIRAYSRRDDESLPAPMDLAKLVGEAVEIVKPRTKGHARKSIDWALAFAETPPVPGHAVDVVSAVVNVLANAIDALGDGGTIRVRTRTITGAGERGRAVVEVRDDGPGMAEDVRRKVLEPFFTTKGAQGTGLGLAMVEACMKRHGGKLELESEPGAGTLVRLTFPC